VRVGDRLTEETYRKQDQYMAAFGGLTVLNIEKDGSVYVRKADVPEAAIDDLSRNLLMFYTNTSRSADEILKDRAGGLQAKGKTS